MPERRVYQRSSLAVEARIEAAGTWHDCRLSNVSAGGAKLTFDGNVAAEEYVQLEIGELGSFPARVVWQHDDEVGILFTATPVEMAEVVMALAMYG